MDVSDRMSVFGSVPDGWVNHVVQHTHTQQTNHLPMVNCLFIKVTVILCFMVKG